MCRIYFMPFWAEKERSKKLHIKENAASVYRVTIIGDDLKIWCLEELAQKSRLQDKEKNSFTVYCSPQQFYESVVEVRGSGRNIEHS